MRNTVAGTELKITLKPFVWRQPQISNNHTNLFKNTNTFWHDSKYFEGMISQENKTGSITCTSLILCPEDRNIKMKGKTTQTAAWTIHASQPFTHLWIDIWYFCQPEQHSCLCMQDAAVLSLTLVGCVPFSAISWVFSAFRMSLSTCSPR